VTGGDSMGQQRVTRTIAQIRADVLAGRQGTVGARPAVGRADPAHDLLLAPVSDEALRMHLARTIRCVRQRSLTDFLL
jgi:hypothetical protein